MSDTISKYKLSFAGALLMTAACIGYIAAPNTWIIVISRIVHGIGYSCCSVSISTWMSNMLPDEKVGSGMGLYGTMNALGMAVAPSIGVSVYQTFGYRAAFCFAMFFSAATAVVIQFIGDKGNPIQTIPVQESDRTKCLQIMDIHVLPISIIIMLFTIPYCATQSFLVSYISERELNVTVSLLFPLYAIVLLLLRLCMKDLFDRLPFKLFLTGSLISAFLGIVLLACMKNNFMMFFSALFMAGGYGIMCSVCQSTAILLAGKEKRGLANSTYFIGLDSGMTLGPIIGGFLYGNVNITLFYPVLLITIPLTIMVYLISHRMKWL